MNNIPQNVMVPVTVGTDGKVYSTGNNTYGQLGQGVGASGVGTVKKDDMTELTNVKYIAAGDYEPTVPLPN